MIYQIHKHFTFESIRNKLCILLVISFMLSSLSGKDYIYLKTNTIGVYPFYSWIQVDCSLVRGIILYWLSSSKFRCYSLYIV